MILIRGVTKVENCFCYTFFIEIRRRKRFIFHFFKVKHVQERMLREIRMRGNFRAAFFLAEPVFPVALTECGGCPSVADTTLTSKGG